jgi:hypothetical protein
VSFFFTWRDQGDLIGAWDLKVFCLTVFVNKFSTMLNPHGRKEKSFVNIQMFVRRAEMYVLYGVCFFVCAEPSRHRLCHYYVISDIPEACLVTWRRKFLSQVCSKNNCMAELLQMVVRTRVVVGVIISTCENWG